MCTLQNLNWHPEKEKKTRKKRKNIKILNFNHFHYTIVKVISVRVNISSKKVGLQRHTIFYFIDFTFVCSTQITTVRFKILNGKNERANKYSNAKTTGFPLHPAARRTHAALKKMLVVSHIKKCGFKRINDPGTDLAAETPVDIDRIRTTN
jgi:hypothetical protein